MATRQEILDDAKLAMSASVDSLKRRFDQVRTGKASPALVDGIMVEYYGAQTRLKDIASVSAPEPRVLKIQPYDISAANAHTQHHSPRA